MNDLAPRALANWLDRSQFPFQSRYFNSGEGRMHYVDEGHGAPIVFVHGTPTWSFLYRHLIAGLSRRYRVIAVDHLGFGLSDKPADATYRPIDHARRLSNFLACMDLDPITLVVHDFGGPIGLSYAIDRPRKVKSLVLFNTWMWSLADDVRVERLSRIASSPLGALLYRGLNASPRVFAPMVYGDRSKLTREIHRHYVKPFALRTERWAPWMLARELAGARRWYASLWERREVLAMKPALLLWGMKDPTFGPDALSRWEAALPLAETMRFANAGHFVPEEVGATLSGTIASFLGTRWSSEPSAA